MTEGGLVGLRRWQPGAHSHWALSLGADDGPSVGSGTAGSHPGVVDGNTGRQGRSGNVMDRGIAGTWLL